MAKASSGPGSSTRTGRKRRSSAGSFSIYFRYSANVVAPSICSSPRPRAGFKMLAASMAPSAAPAPTMVCISSTNKMMFPARRISWSKSRTRSSNSPRYLVPATRFAMFRLSSRLSRSCTGTRPATMRWASASAMAVFPTPGSPMRAGLFLFFRLRMLITASSSCSRPMTGSMEEAFSNRSSLNCSRSFVVSTFPFRFSSRRRLTRSMVWVNTPSTQTPDSSRSCRPEARSCRARASSTCSGRMRRLPAWRASPAACRRMLRAPGVSPWGSRRPGAPLPHRAAAISRRVSACSPALRKIRPARVSGCPSRPSSRCALPT